MTIEERIAELKALKPSTASAQNKEMKEQLTKLEKLNEIKGRLTFLEKQIDKLSTEQCCELLEIPRVVFLKYRVRLKIAGGTPEHPLFNRNDVLKLKDMFDAGKKH